MNIKKYSNQKVFVQDHNINDYKLHCSIKYRYSAEKEIMILNMDNGIFSYISI